MIKIEINYSMRTHIFEPVVQRIIPKVFDDDGIVERLKNHPMALWKCRN